MTDDQTPQVNVNVNQAEPSVRITLTTIYGQQLRMENVLTGLLTKVEAAITSDHDHENRIRGLERSSVNHDHEKRIRAIERSTVTKGQAAWAYTAILLLFGTVAAVLGLFR